MGFRAIGIVSVVFLLVMMPAAQTSAQSSSSGKVSTSFSVMYLRDTETGSDGIGLSLTIQKHNLADITFAGFFDYFMMQASMLAPRQIGALTAYWGFSVGYAQPMTGGAADPFSYWRDVPEGIMTGIQVKLAHTNIGRGFSLDLRASSMAEGLSPTKWLTDPDSLWLGAGLSYKF